MTYGHETGSRWFKGCVCAIARPSSALSKGTWQAGYQLGQDATDAQTYSSARAYCSTVASEETNAGEISLLTDERAAHLQGPPQRGHREVAPKSGVVAESDGCLNL